MTNRKNTAPTCPNTGIPSYNVAVFGAGTYGVEEYYRKNFNARDIFKMYAGKIREYENDGERLCIWLKTD